MNRRAFLAKASVVAGTVSIAGCSTDETDESNTGDGNDVKTEEEPQQPEGTRWYDADTEIGILEGVEAEIDSIGSMYIRGTAENYSNTDYDYVQLEFAVYDESEAKIADGLANTSGLQAGQQWRFEALAASAEDADSYSLTGVTAY